MMNRQERTALQQQAIIEAASVLADNCRGQAKKGHWLNVHFRAFELAYLAWQAHIAEAVNYADSGAQTGDVCP